MKHFSAIILTFLILMNLGQASCLDFYKNQKKELALSKGKNYLKGAGFATGLGFMNAMIVGANAGALTGAAFLTIWGGYAVTIGGVVIVAVGTSDSIRAIKNSRPQKMIRLINQSNLYLNDLSGVPGKTLAKLSRKVNKQLDPEKALNTEDLARYISAANESRELCRSYKDDFYFSDVRDRLVNGELKVIEL